MKMWAEAMRPLTLRNLPAINSHGILKPRLQAPRCAPQGQEPRTFRTVTPLRNCTARRSGFIIPAAGSSTNRTALGPAFPDFNFSGPALSTFCAILSSLALAPASLAAEGVFYNPQEGSDTLKTVAGVGYIILVIVYFVRLFKKRADRFTSVRISSSDSADIKSDEEEEEEEEGAVAAVEEDVSPTQCLIGFAQAAVICYFLYLLSTNVDAYFAKQDLPTQYTARNIAILIQTVGRGLVYLATFIFGANAVGVGALGLALVVAPEWVNSGGRPQGRKEEKLPDVKITDDIFTLRRAFKEAEEMGRRNAEKNK